jgi:succinyl-CoA synthetase beta subunit
MAQVAIREYDAKRMFAEFSSSPYPGYLIESERDIDDFVQHSHTSATADLQPTHPHSTWVIKPDQLFGKRGKYGLIGVDLSVASIRDWWSEYDQREVTLATQQ